MPSPTPPDQLHTMLNGVILGAAALGLLTGALPCLFGVMELSKGEPAGLFLLGFGLCCASAGPLTWFFIKRNSLTERSLGPVTIIAESPVSRGQVVPVQVSFTPQREGSVHEITATLRATRSTTITFTSYDEENKTSSRETRTDRTYTDYNTTTLASQLQLTPGQQRTFETTFTIPADAPLPFERTIDMDTSEALSWCVHVTIKLPNVPEWRRSASLTFAPVADEDREQQAPPAVAW